MKLFNSLLISSLVLFSSACSKSELSSDNSQMLASGSNYMNDNSIIRVYWKNAGFGTFISSLAAKDGKLLLPTSLQTGGDFGSRISTNTAVSLDLVAKVYNPFHASGDFYFESPILSPEISVTNVTTALSWFLEAEFNGAPIKISQDIFNQFVLNVEIICHQCREKTNSQVFNLIRTSSLAKSFRNKVISQNPGIDFTDKSWTPLKAQWVWSDPLITLNLGLKSIRELEAIHLLVLYVDPENSTKKIVPTSWFDNYSSAQFSSEKDGSLQMQFGYDDSGTHLITPSFPKKTEDGTLIPDNAISFQISVEDVNRPPICNSAILVMRANVLSRGSLNTFCSDPDIDNSFLTYSLENGPAGMNINSVGMVTWSPLSPQGDAFEQEFSFRTTDAKSGATLAPGKILVTQDKFPQFDSISTNYSFTEGSEGQFTITAHDDDGDPLLLTIVSTQPVATLLPPGSGDLTKITRTGSNGVYTFTVKFTPGFLQTIAVDGSLHLKMHLSYDNSGDISYNTNLKFDERDVTFHITNADDPPLFTVEPGDILATEGVDIGGVYIGEAIDPLPHPTTLSYSITSSSADPSCAWASNLTVLAVADSLYLSGMPAYFSAAECRFKITAIDMNGLSANSKVFKINSANTNQPITLCSTGNSCQAPPLTQIEGSEGVEMSLPIKQIFDDPDMNSTPIDAREIYTYECHIDLDHNGTYETMCADVSNLRIAFSSTSLQGTAAPQASSAGTYPVRLKVTDVGGTHAVHDFNLIIAESASPMILSTSLKRFAGDTEEVSEIYNVNEGETYYLSVTATAATARAIDIYDYDIIPQCSASGTIGGCSATLIESPLELNGLGTKTFIFAVRPLYFDADTLYPATTKNYSVSFYSQKTNDINLNSQISITLIANNTNRAPTAISLGKGSFGCSGSSENSDSDTFVICINGDNDSKNGLNWTKTYTVPLNFVDPDNNNGFYTYSMVGNYPGTITGNNWNIKLPSCVNSSTGTITRTYVMTLNDGYGGKVSRNIQLKIQRVSGSTTCL